MSLVSVLAWCLGRIRPQSEEQCSPPLTVNPTLGCVLRVRIIQIQLGGGSAGADHAPLSQCGVPHCVLALRMCQRGGGTAAGTCCEQETLVRPGSEALIIIKFTNFAIVFAA